MIWTAPPDYGQVCKLINQVMTGQTYDLIERAAERVAQEILLTFPLVERLELELHKPEAPIPYPFGDVSVKIERGWHKVYIAFGSNMGEKEYYLEKGLDELKRHPLCKSGKMSSIYRTSPYGGVEQEDFLNGVLELYTLLSLLNCWKKCSRWKTWQDVSGKSTGDRGLLIWICFCMMIRSLIQKS